jgi:hypothetical protein
MLLEDLSKYAADQNKRIAKLPSTAISPASSIWEKFRSSHWGKPLTSFEKEEPLEYDLDPAPSLTPPTNRSILTVAQEQLEEWHLSIPNGKILVRSEYHETEQAVLFGSGIDKKDVFLVTGQPGIGSFTPPPHCPWTDCLSGKSVFLLWLLVRRLAYELPTVLQVDQDQVILFHEGGTIELTQPKARGQYSALRSTSSMPLGRIWALVDTNPRLSIPASIVADNSRFYVVDAVSVGSGDLEWVKKVGYEFFYQKPWSPEEILQAYVGILLGLRSAHFSVVARSSVPAGVSSYICTKSLVHLPASYDYTQMIRFSIRITS